MRIVLAMAFGTVYIERSVFHASHTVGALYAVQHIHIR